MRVNVNPSYGSKYHRQGLAFLRLTKAKLRVTKVAYGQMWDDKKRNDWRDIYKVTILRSGKKPVSFRFGQSIAETQKGNRPSAYDILSVLQKYPIGTYENFLSEFGYEDDAKGRRTYKAIVREYEKLASMFSERELELMGKI